jgi:hypothetical protein
MPLLGGVFEFVHQRFTSRAARRPHAQKVSEKEGQIPLANARAILAAARSVGFHALPERVVEAVVANPLTVIGAVIRPGRNSQFVVRGLEKLHSAAQIAPRPNSHRERTLDDLHGLGDAAVWGRALAADLKALQAGEIDWADVDRGVLISGPSGTGKRMLENAHRSDIAQALALTRAGSLRTECEVTVNGSDPPHGPAISLLERRNFQYEVIELDHGST